VPLLSGRLLGTSDGREGQNTVIVNETLARFCWPGQAAVGKRLRSIRNKDEVLEVVGVVGDIRDGSYDQYVGPICYTPFASFPNLFHQRFSLFVRTRVDPVTLIATLRRELQAMAPPGFRTPAFEVVTQSLYENTAQRRLYMGCLSGFAAIGVILSVIGIYGVLAWTVTRRTKEIGVRMACGASPTQALGLVLRQGLFMTSIGIVLGVAGAMALTRFLSSYLFGVGPLDPITFIGASLLLGAVALLACYVPARRAARIDPMAALRYE
jgi:ABC-type lipoprotein release transport system permease subunit